MDEFNEYTDCNAFKGLSTDKFGFIISVDKEKMLTINPVPIIHLKVLTPEHHAICKAKNRKYLTKLFSLVTCEKCKNHWKSL